MKNLRTRRASFWKFVVLPCVVCAMALMFSALFIAFSGTSTAHGGASITTGKAVSFNVASARGSVSCTPEANQMPEANQAPEANETPEANQAPEANETPEANQAPEANGPAENC